MKAITKKSYLKMALGFGWPVGKSHENWQAAGQTVRGDIEQPGG
jgi:hypothetical protein